MHIFNKTFQKVFLITIGPPNDRFEYISSYLKSHNITYDLRVATNRNFFQPITFDENYINPPNQSLSAQYASIFCENYYNNIESFVVLEDDNIFCEDFENKFEQFFNRVPSDWDVLHLGDYNITEHIKYDSVDSHVNRVYLKYTTNCMVFRNKKNFKSISDLINKSKNQIDYVLNDFYIKKILNCYCPTDRLTEQLSYRKGIDPIKKFDSLLQY